MKEWILRLGYNPDDCRTSHEARAMVNAMTYQEMELFANSKFKRTQEGLFDA